MSIKAPSILPLQAENLVYRAGGKRLIDDVSFVLPKGGITALIGPNGAGKSLLLRLCHGLLTPAEGVVHWQSPPAPGAGHGFVFQQPVMLRRSVRANLDHVLAACAVPDRAARLVAALDRFALAAFADRPARALSGGEQQRLALARAWALQPELLFLDEPTAQLDPGATRQIEALIMEMAGEGMTILMISHDFGQARRLASRVMMLNQGRLIEDGPTATVFSAPRTPEARAFLAGDLVW